MPRKTCPLLCIRYWQRMVRQLVCLTFESMILFFSANVKLKWQATKKKDKPLGNRQPFVFHLTELSKSQRRKGGFSLSLWLHLWDLSHISFYYLPWQAGVSNSNAGTCNCASCSAVLKSKHEDQRALRKLKKYASSGEHPASRLW